MFSHYRIKCLPTLLVLRPVIAISNKTENVVYRNIGERSCEQFCHGKAISNTYSECVSIALVMQHAKSMRPTLLSSVICLAMPYNSIFFFFTDGTTFGKEYTSKMRAVIFSTNFV